MRLIAIPVDDEALRTSSAHWMPFLPLIAKRSKEPLTTLIDRIMRKEMRLVLVWDEQRTRAAALLGVRLHYRGDDLIGELLWLVGDDCKSWQHLLPDVEQMLRDAGCVECRPLCRPGWSRLLKQQGYKLTHVQMEKVL